MTIQHPEFELFSYQQEVLDAEASTPGEQLRVCLYYRTGAGKSITSALLVKQAGAAEVLVVAPPSTHASWRETCASVGLVVECVSHAKFRMADYKVHRSKALIMDEFHLLGGHTGKGWKKLDRLAAGLKAPLILNSATPNYNDAERVYCIQHVLDPQSCRGGFLEFLYLHCNTAQNPFGMTPLVDKERPFKHCIDAADYLRRLPGVYYVQDNVVYSIEDHHVRSNLDQDFLTYGYDRRRHRILASQIEESHARVNYGLAATPGALHQGPWTVLHYLINEGALPLLVFANHSTIAEVAETHLARAFPLLKVGLVTGKTPEKKKEQRIQAFRDGALHLLVGTSTLATGTDGLDKVCDTLLILDDTDDDALRRQLIGRIMPRGADADASNKEIHRIVLQP